MSTTRNLVALSAPEAAELVSPDSLVLLPVGAIEQHGPHLPLDTDALLAEAAAQALLDDPPPGVDLWTLPTLAYSTSSEHLFAAGTMSLSEETFLAVLDDLGRSVAALPARRLVILNGHGGNTALFRVACRRLRLQYGLLTFLVHPVLSADHGGPKGEDGEDGLGCHANCGETSLLLHLHPDRVHLERAVSNVPRWLADYDHVGLGGDVTFGWSAGDFGDSGVIGDPTRATPERGAELWAAILVELRAALVEVARFDFPASVLSGRR
ncbi:MAG: putative creatinine amidohydrolase (creatininase) [Actinomycetia bacterium]|nr:putative creatinine amidohydrolase (creatininase) [Actinomycetes bacterium]